MTIGQKEITSKSIRRSRTVKRLDSFSLDAKSDECPNININRILVCRPNHRLGNLLLITPILQEVVNAFPHCKIDLFVKGNLGPIIFKNFQNIDRIFQLPRKPFSDLMKYISGWVAMRKQRYDLVINVVHNSSSGKLSAQLANARYKFFGGDKRDGEMNTKADKHIAKYPVYHFRRYLSKLGFKKTKEPIASLNLQLTALEFSEGKKALKNLVKNEKPTICLFTYATGEKCYAESWWQKFYERLQKEYPNHNIIEVLPIENISKISFKAPTYYSRDIREIGSLIANTQLFIGADSGIMHLANAVQIPTIGLFSVTDEDVYRPYNNNSFAINTNRSSNDECIKVLDKILKPKSSHIRPSAHSGVNTEPHAVGS